MSDNEVKLFDTMSDNDSSQHTPLETQLRSRRTYPSPPTPKKEASKKRKTPVKENVSDDEGDNVDEPTTPEPTPKGQGKDEDSNKTPTKKVKTEGEGSAKRAVSKKMESSDDFTEADHITLRFKEEGKSWPAIDDEVERVTGKRPGNSVCRKRYPKLLQILSSEKMVKGFTDQDRDLLFKAHDEGEKKYQAMLKKFEAERWDDIRDYMVKEGAGDYEASALKKKFAELKGPSTSA